MPNEKSIEMRLPSLDELFSSQEERDDAKLKRIYEISLSDIDPFPDHPFKVQDDEDILGIIIGVLLALFIAIAIIRTVIKTRRGDHIEVPPVGVMNDLPSSVTGINKHDDMRERSTERANRR